MEVLSLVTVVTFILDGEAVRILTLNGETVEIVTLGGEAAGPFTLGIAENIHVK